MIYNVTLCPSGKVPYTSRNEAKTWAKRSRFPAQKYPYKCKHCPSWHLTSRKRVAKSHRDELRRKIYL